VFLLVAVAFHPAINPVWDYVFSFSDDEVDMYFADALDLEDIPAVNAQPEQQFDVSELNIIAKDNSDIDTDADGLYNSVETVLGTDLNNTDTDFDQLSDYDEAINGTDPLYPDSNNDGIADYVEMYNISLDLDNDSIMNAWDADNDNDGVTDGIDLSPFSKSEIYDSFSFNVKTNGNPAFMNFQIRPNQEDHLTLPLQYWDWPEDDEGVMRDLNNSEEDVFILPYLEMSIQTDFKIISENSGKCLTVSNASHTENATIEQNTYVGDPSQQWSIVSVAEGYVKIISSHSGMCLEVKDASLDNNAPIIQGTYEGGDYQHWKLQPLEDNSYAIFAKHSQKCLQVYNANLDDNASVNQSAYSGKTNQIWILEPVEDVIPDQSEIADYGATIELNKILIPLTPIWDYGDIPAFNGKMYYPESESLNLSAEVKLIWKVHGKSDTPIGALIAYNDKLVSVNNTNVTATVNPSEIADQEIFEWVDLGEDRVALKAYNGKYLTLTKKYGFFKDSWMGMDWLAADKDEYYILEANSSEIGENETFDIVVVSGNNIALKASNGHYVTAKNPCDDSDQLAATSSIIGSTETFTRLDLGYRSPPLPLVSYYEDFMFTGFNVQENYGTNIACFYDEDINQTIKAGFVMAYEFLRNHTDLSDMPTVLNSRNITFNFTIDDTSAHQDESIFKLMGEMLPQVMTELNNQSPNATLPIIIALEDHFTSKSMDEITQDLIIQGSNLEIDITSNPIVTAKLFKMNWYNTTDFLILDTEYVLLEAMQWGLELGFDEEDDSLLMMMALLNTWNAGEYKITNVGGVEIEFNIAESPLVLDILQYSFFAVTTVIDVIKIMTEFNKMGEYRALAFLGKILKPIAKALGKAIMAGLKVLRLNKVALKSLNALKAIGKAIKSSKAAQGVIKFFKSAKLLSVLDKLGPLLILIDLAITGVIAFYMFWSILFEEGFSDFGAALGAWVVIFSFVYAGLYIALALALPVIGIILVILDMIFDFFGKLLEWFLDLVTKTEIRSKVDLGFLGTPSLETHDYDNNGFDVGDRIDFTAQIYALVWKTSKGSASDIRDSYIRPKLKISVPEGSNSGSFKTKTSTVTTSSKRNETYEMGVWVYPIAMSNFPMTIQLKYDYKIYYNECVWFFGWWCDRESDSGSETTDIATLYFDVLPGNLTSFLYWNELTPLDSDGDGLSDKEELKSASNPWRVDTDGDGLWDKYEVDQGTIPYKSDSDGDGLNDQLEIRIETETNNTDSDEDGLTDYEEYRGWQIEFEFYGNPILMNVSSDPMIYDTDNDGLNDLVEFIKGLNPRSNDTDADGILDPDEIRFPYQGLISGVDFNDKGSSIRVTPNSTINADVTYRLIGIECPSTSQPANCSIVMTLENNDFGNIIMNQTIYEGTPDIFNITENITSFSFNASEEEGIYLVKYYVNWSCLGIIPSIGDREIIGIIDVNVSDSGIFEWECYDLSGGDKDGDRISNLNENIGWLVSYTDSTGDHIVHVTSDPRSIDTDSDGEWDIWEHNCFENSTNPRDPDTDNDGLNDWEEKYRYKTNPLDYDTDGDGLDDQNELIFGSDPFEVDTDLDGLNDKIEFDLKSNPNDPDTDNDGLNDLEEYLFDSSLLLPDTDYDMLFDKMEYNLTTNPRDPDTDDDQLIDGYEIIVKTNPKKADTDNDTLNDYYELYWRTDPLYDDTDNDSLIDGKEIQYGTHPLVKDTDRDGIKDFDDYDTYTPHVDNIVLAFDLDEDILEFEEHLETYSNVTTVTIEQLLSNPNYKNSPYIVLVGRLDSGIGTVGNLSRSILEDAGENTTAIIESGYNFFAVKYGIWNKTQTIVMLSHPYRLDHLVVLNVLKTMWKNVNGSTVEIQWPTPRDSFQVEAVNEINTLLWAYLDQSVAPWIILTLYNASTTPNTLTKNLGLASNEKTIDKYISIQVSENVQNETQDIVKYALIFFYYTASDLDKTGDGDANDVGDINEKTLSFYVFDENKGRWVKLSKNLDWVNDVGVDTKNVEIYGKTYEGYVWANVSHFSLYGLAGNPITYNGGGTGGEDTPPISDIKLRADASASEKTGFINSPIRFNGSLSISNTEIIFYTWDFGDGNTGTGQKTTHIYSKVGNYTVKLTVMDDSGETDTDIIEVLVTFKSNPPSKPIINGSMVGKINNKYIYTALSSDIDPEDQIKYGWDWDNDDIVDEWTDLYPSGSLSTINHTFLTKGFYRVKTRAEDNNGIVSEWSDRLLIFIDVDYQQKNDGTYIIDNNKDGKWDDIYDPKTDELKKYKGDESLSPSILEGFNLFIIIQIITALILLMVILVIIPKIKKRKNKK